MSVQSEITRLSDNVTAALAAIADKGVTVPDGSNSDSLAPLIASIEAGGGGGGGGSVPKPLTYDYMPEGYPKKTMETVTLMEEQEVAFALEGGFYSAQLTNAFEIVVDQTYTVNWDGTEYECVCYTFNSMPALGNLSIYGGGNDTGEPFIYVYNSNQAVAGFTANDTSASHTISVKRTEEIVTPMAEEFLPVSGGQLIVVVYNANASGTEHKADKTYDEISAAIESGIRVVIHSKKSITSADYTVYYHVLTEAGYYRFCNFDNDDAGYYLNFVNIYKENGKMVILKEGIKMQIAT